MTVVKVSTPGPQGQSSYQAWLAAGNVGTPTQFLASLVGQSAYQEWLAAGNTGDEAQFLASLVGAPGQSAYQAWLASGNTGTEEQFLASLVGQPGTRGPAGPRGISDRIVSAGSFSSLNSPGPVLSNGTDTGCNALEARFIPYGAADLRTVWSNVNGTGSITITQSIQFPSGVTPQPVTWNGATSVTIPAGQFVISDPFQGAFNVLGVAAPGVEIWLRTFLSCMSGTKFELVNSSGLGQQSGTTQTDQTLNYTFNYGTAGVAQIGAVAIVGSPLAASHAIGGAGDSIMRGEGDSTGGDVGPLNLIAGGFAASAHAWANAGTVGATAAGFATQPTKLRQMQLKYCDTIITNFGTNDIGYNPSISLAALQINVIASWWACSGLGARVIACTLLPRSTSTDSWATAQNQTPQSGFGPGGVRAQLNAWMRAGAPMQNGVAVAVGTAGAIIAGQAGHPLYAVADWAAAVEPVQDSGVWAVNGSAFYATVDGTHPTHAASQLIAAAFNTALLA